MCQNPLQITLVVVVALALFLTPQPVFGETDGPHAATVFVPTLPTEWSLSITFPRFDPALGFLTAVQLDLLGEVTTDITIVNGNPLSGLSGNARTDVKYTVQDTGMNLVDPGLVVSSPTYFFNLTDAEGGMPSGNSGPMTDSNSSSNTYTLLAILTEFTGVVPIILSADTETVLVVGPPGGSIQSEETVASLNGSVTYFYEPVPEPSTLVLAALGAIGALGCWWSRWPTLL
jgi:hypothetical protein